jgi:hypothetical protein
MKLIITFEYLAQTLLQNFLIVPSKSMLHKGYL